MWTLIDTDEICTTELSVGWWGVQEPRLPNAATSWLVLLLIIGGIDGVYEGEGGNGTTGWVAVAVFVWLILRCTSINQDCWWSFVSFVI